VMQEWLESAFLQKTGRHLEDRLHAQHTCLHAASPSTVMADASLLAHPRIAVFCSTPTAPEVNVARVIQLDIHDDHRYRLSRVRA
jgi:hypothetical protein